MCRSTSKLIGAANSEPKTFTAVAVMQLWERALLELDAPANVYLRAFRLVPADAAGGLPRFGIC